MQKKKIIFFVQGEGRGHLMQAIGLSEKIDFESFEICAVVYGKSSKKKQIPDFFKNNFNCEIIELLSPSFYQKRNKKGISIPLTTLNFLRNLRNYFSSVRQTHDLIKKHKPEIILNFYDPLMALYLLFYKKEFHYYGIGHQYIYLHDDFSFPKGKIIQRLLIKSYTKFTAFNSDKLFALSFYPLKKQDKLIVVPPILRKEILGKEGKNDKFILVYLSNNGFLKELFDWHQKNDACVVHCFTDKTNLKGHDYTDENFYVHQINDKEFIDKLIHCEALCCTAGFEAVCEAMYLSKPVLMIPMENHFEQFCNSRDAYFAGAGIYSDSFDLSPLLNFRNSFSGVESFKHWVGKNDLRLNSDFI